MTKPEILKRITFGERTAEEESDNLSSYFVETDEWRQLFSGEADIIYGPKGSGKSALYALLADRTGKLFDEDILTVQAENVRGATVFSDLTTNPPANEEKIRNLWKLYFLSLIGYTFREYGIRNTHSEELIHVLEEASILTTEWDLGMVLRSVREYLSNFFQPDAIEGGVTLDHSGHPSGVTAKIIFGQPTQEQYDLGIRSVRNLVDTANQALEEEGVDIWILLDRLDVAFASTKKLEGNALRSLFRVYLDLKSANRISPKIFLRSDIWDRITVEGFREASHITKSINIRWDDNTLLNVVMRRLLQNEEIVDYLSVDKNEVLDDIERQREVFYRVFPDQIDVGEKKPSAFDWMLYRTVDGSDEYVPRELIHLLGRAREIQLKRYETGVEDPEGENIFERRTFKEALPDVSSTRLENTLYAEYPDLREWLKELEGEKAEQYPESLSRIWEVERSQALQIANRLVEVGFFEKRGDNQDPSFWTPFLYRPALDLTQGSAER
ncbi:hypothetical protein GGP57_001526 [Salinibacter ruber]|uniref:P-loop ATPase, Sll1717 family n=1 Tax=Salinibacter ruber TaxID=146919 RepID=UPI0021699F3C|nr:hypothetical protein [Salinibacter ruber]MCS3634205.1 hypothetical protein [Salinibacter ruber]MCS3713695.1 hypothetical protein [Salinibacter ruber]